MSSASACPALLSAPGVAPGFVCCAGVSSTLQLLQVCLAAILLVVCSTVPIPPSGTPVLPVPQPALCAEPTGKLSLHNPEAAARTYPPVKFSTWEKSLYCLSCLVHRSLLLGCSDIRALNLTSTYDRYLRGCQRMRRQRATALKLLERSKHVKMCLSDCMGKTRHCATSIWETLPDLEAAIMDIF